MKKINLKSISKGLSRDEMRSIKGGSGGFCPSMACGGYGPSWCSHISGLGDCSCNGVCVRHG